MSDVLAVGSSSSKRSTSDSHEAKKGDAAQRTVSAGAPPRRRLAGQIDIIHRDQTVEVRFCAPCQSIEQLRFEAKGTALTVEARWDDEAEAGPVLFARKHTFVLDQPVDIERLDATFEDGMVTLSIPKLSPR